MRTKPTAWLIVGIFAGVLGGTVGAVQAGVRINLSPSMPKGLYRLVQCDETAGRDAAVGDWVAIDTKEASSNPGLAFFRSQGWLSYSGRSDDLLMKTIVGVGGDEVTEKDGRLYVNGRLSQEARRRDNEPSALFRCRRWSFRSESKRARCGSVAITRRESTRGTSGRSRGRPSLARWRPHGPCDGALMGFGRGVGRRRVEWPFRVPPGRAWRASLLAVESVAR